MNASYRWVCEELARYTYKPGFTMEAIPPHRRSPDSTFADLVEVRFTMLVPDARRVVPTGRTVFEPPKIVAAFDSISLYDAPFSRLEMERPIIPVTGTRIVDEDVIGYPDLFGAWLMRQLDSFERHEMREWLRRDGELVDDPHAPLGLASPPESLKGVAA